MQREANGDLTAPAPDDGENDYWYVNWGIDR